MVVSICFLYNQFISLKKIDLDFKPEELKIIDRLAYKAFICISEVTTDQFNIQTKQKSMTSRFLKINIE